MAKRLGIHNTQQVAWRSVLDGAAEAEGVRSRQPGDRATESRSRLEQHFDPTFATRLALREKQIQELVSEVVPKALTSLVQNDIRG